MVTITVINTYPSRKVFAMRKKIEELEEQQIEFLVQREEYRYTVGNILHESVPTGETEESNEIIRSIGEKKKV